MWEAPGLLVAGLGSGPSVGVSPLGCVLTVCWCVCVLAAPGALRQRGPQGEGLPEDGPAQNLREVPRPASFYTKTDQQYFSTVRQR